MAVNTESILHEFSSVGQMFRSYSDLLDNPQLNINHRKLKEMCDKCAKKCLEARNLLIEGVGDARVTETK